MTIQTRLEKAIKDASGFNNIELAEKVTTLIRIEKPKAAAVPAATIQTIRADGARSFYIPHLAEVLGVSAIWLAEGYGNQYGTSGELVQRDINIINTYEAFPVEFRAPMRSLIDAIIKTS